MTAGPGGGLMSGSSLVCYRSIQGATHGANCSVSVTKLGRAFLSLYTRTTDSTYVSRTSLQMLLAQLRGQCILSACRSSAGIHQGGSSCP